MRRAKVRSKEVGDIENRELPQISGVAAWVLGRKTKLM